MRIQKERKKNTSRCSLHSITQAKKTNKKPYSYIQNKNMNV